MTNEASPTSPASPFYSLDQPASSFQNPSISPSKSPGASLYAADHSSNVGSSISSARTSVTRATRMRKLADSESSSATAVTAWSMAACQSGSCVFGKLSDESGG